MLIGFFDANRLTIDIFLLPVAGRTKGDRQNIVVDNGSLCGEQQTVGGYIVNGYFMRFIKKLRLPFNIRGSGNLYFGAQAFSSPDFLCCLLSMSLFRTPRNFNSSPTGRVSRKDKICLLIVSFRRSWMRASKP